MLTIAGLNNFALQPARVINFKGLENTLKQSNNAYLMAFDLDGTFLECNKGDIEKFVKLAAQKKHKLAYVTARKRNELDKLIANFARKGINLPLPDYFAACNGQFIYEKKNGKLSAIPLEEWNNILSKTNFDRDTTKTVVSKFIEENKINSKPAMLQFDYRPSQFNVEYLVHHKLRPVLHKKIDKYFKQNNIKANVLLEYVPAEAVKKGIARRPDFNEKIKYMLDKDGGLYAANITAVDKGEAVEFLRNRLAVDKNHVITAGNDGNDVSMAAKGYWFVVVHNARQLLKELLQNINQEKIIRATKDGAAGINEAIEKIFSQVGLLFR